jgi:protein-tyrosine phosphatase
MTTLDITLSAPVNLRDLGGIPVAGGTLRQGLAVRADDLSMITEADAVTLTERGLSSVIDLRSSGEVALTGRGPLAGLPVAYHHLPLMADIGAGMPREGLRAFTHEAMGRMYVRMVEGAAPQLATALTVIALAPGATAFHCAAGRDRTGVVAALLLLALGATDDDIVEDYARTEPNMPAINERMRPVMGVLLGRLGFDLDEMTALQSGLSEAAMAISMRILLSELRERHGDPLAPVRAAGLGDETIARLRARAVVV